MQEIGKRAMQEPGKSDARNDKKKVRWRIANPEEAQTQGERLRYYRDTVHRLSQEELGNRIGISGSQISRYENDEDWPRGETLEKIAAELNVKVQQITRGEQGLGSDEKSTSLRASDQQESEERIAEISVPRLAQRVIQARGVAQPVITFAKAEFAYHHIADLVRGRGAEKVDLLQFSGDTVRPLLEAVAERSRAVKIRLLLYAPVMARQYDSDHKIEHRGRITTTIGEVRLLETENNLEQPVEIYHYRTPASVSSVIIDDEIICLSWYRAYREPNSKTVRLRGHDSAALVILGARDTILQQFARTHFDRILATATRRTDEPSQSPHRNRPKRSAIRRSR
ncbi:MAG: helix-turn-helix transcriptional regulator [Xanthobacteraceae bacterium]